MGIFDNSNRGLWVNGPPESIPRDALRRATGVHPIKTRSVRSRNGSTKIYDTDVGGTPTTAHSLFRFNGIRFAGVGSELQRANTDIVTGLDGTRLAWVQMPPTTGIVDYLFVCGGGDVIKVDTSGNVTDWGIAAPSTGLSGADGGAGNLTGTYKYRVTFLNSATGSRSNPNATDLSITVTAKQVDLSSIPTSLDAQVNAREIWRTVGNGAVKFRVTTITDNVTTTYTDNISDANLETLEMQIDNNVPPADVDDAIGPYVSRMWWTRRSTGGTLGRLYYSPIGRAEAFASFIDPSTDDDPIQKAILWAGSLWVFTRSRIFQIIGTDEPFLWREVFGAPGTIQPYSVTATPFGILYQAVDGVRVFNGSNSRLASPEAINTLFRGESPENLTAFVGVVATYGRDEYYISNAANTTLALSLRENTWRDIGLVSNALFFETDTKELIHARNNDILILEDEGVVTDDGSAISINVQTPSESLGPGVVSFVRRVIIDGVSPSITPTLLLDNGTLALTAFSETVRTQVDYSVNRLASVYALRLSGSVSTAMDIARINIDAIPLTLWVTFFPSGTRIGIPGIYTGGAYGSIIFETDPKEPLNSIRSRSIIRRLYIDYSDAGSNNITPVINYVGGSSSRTALSAAGRTLDEDAVELNQRFTSLELRADYTALVRIFNVELDIHKVELE